MTCIIGLIDKDNNCVVIGADSAGSSGSNITPRKDTKVFKVDDFIFGCTESFRMMQLLRFSLSLPKIYDTDIYEYMCTKFVNSVRECFSTGGYLQQYEEGDEKGGTFIVGYKDRLFTIYDDFQVEESLLDYNSVGSGSHYALGALYVLTNNPDLDLSSKEIVHRALNSATQHCSSVSLPFNLISTKDD